jgi:hypothetical protein
VSIIYSNSVISEAQWKIASEIFKVWLEFIEAQRYVHKSLIKSLPTEL